MRGRGIGAGIAVALAVGALVGVADAGATRAVAPPDRIPTVRVDWTRARLAGGADRLIVAEAIGRGSDLGRRYTVRQLDVGGTHWRRRPDAPGLPVVVHGGLLAVFLRCRRVTDESDPPCDVVAARLPDGAPRWRSTVVSRRTEGVHEGGEAVPVASTPTTVIVTTFRARRQDFEIGLHGARSLPALPALPDALGAQRFVQPIATCAVGARLVHVASDFGTPGGDGAGVAWSWSLPLHSDHPVWSRADRLVVPGGVTAPASFACSGRGVLAFVGDRTLLRRQAGWARFATGTPAGLFGASAALTTATDLVLPALAANSSIAGSWWLHRHRWTALPAAVAPGGIAPGPVIAPFGADVVALADGPTGPALRVLRATSG